MRILLDPKAGGGNGKPPTTNIVPMRPIKPTKEQLSQTFSLADDDPLLSGDSSRLASTAVEKKETPKVEPVPGNTNIEAPIQLPAQAKEEKEEEVKEKAPEKKPIESILKAPKGEKKEEKGEKKEEVVKQIVPPSKDKTPRDYTGIDPTIVPHLKQMSNEAFKFVKGLLDEKKELEKLKDTSFLQHPDAYTLSPDYRQIQAQTQLASHESQLWQQALVDCRNGKKFKFPAGFDKDGKFIMEEREPSDQNEILLQKAMLACDDVARQSGEKLNNLKGQFSSRVQQDSQMIQQENAKRFAWVSDPKLLDYSIEIEGVGDKTLKEIQNDFVSLFPPYLRNNPATMTAANIFIALRIQDAQLKEALAQLKEATTREEETKRAEPNSSIKPAEPPGEAINGVKIFSLEGMPS